MKRIETRDLYHCSCKIRIPKIFKLPLASPSDLVAGTVIAKWSGREGNGDTNFWKALMEMTKQPEGISIYKCLAPEKRSRDEKKHLWVPVSV